MLTSGDTREKQTKIRCVLILITPSRIGGNNRANLSESTPPRAAKARSVNRQSPAPDPKKPCDPSSFPYPTGFYVSFFDWRICTHDFPRPILIRQLRPCLGELRETEASSLD